MRKIETEQEWMEVFQDQHKKIIAVDSRWISVLELGRLPERGVWVQLLEDDRMNPHSVTWSKIYNPRMMLRVVPGMLCRVDEYGYAVFCHGYNGGWAIHASNVTHWQPLAEIPNIEPFPYEQ